MPAKSEAQKRLFCMAYAVRQGKLERVKVKKAVLDIVDSEMTDQEIKDFMVKECTLQEYLNEALTPIPYSSKEILVKEETPIKKVFIVIKPGFFDLAEDILDIFKREGFIIYQTRTKRLTLEEAKKLYEVHKKEDFYNDLCEYMSSGLSTGVTLRPNKNWSKDILFKRVDAIKDKIRDKWSESDMRNVIHSSDSLENMLEEEKIYFTI